MVVVLRRLEFISWKYKFKKSIFVIGVEKILKNRCMGVKRRLLIFDLKYFFKLYIFNLL